jgi:dTDP-4-dehydrorhamnose reductase
MLTVLITGATGMLGSALYKLWRKKYNLCLTGSSYYKNMPTSFIQCNLINDEFSILQRACKPDIIVNCAACTSHEICQNFPERAYAVNALAPLKLAKAFPDSYLIQISTDAVFGADVSFPAEDFKPIPETVYGKTKLEGEKLLLNNHINSIVLRTTIVGLGGKRSAPSLAQWILESAMASRIFYLYTDVIFSPVSIWDFANLLDWCITMQPHGTFHACGSESISKYDFGLRLLKSCGLLDSGVHAGSLSNCSDGIKRRLNQSLDSRKLATLSGSPLPDCDACVASIARRYYEK